MKYPLLFLVLFCEICHGSNISDYFKKDTSEKTHKNQIKNIDFVYLINLDQRPEKLKKCMSQLTPFNIFPHRFSAIYGWDLSAEAFKNLGVTFLPGMLTNKWVADGTNDFKYEFLREDCYGKTVFFYGISPGAIGCTLSHLSVLQDAYDSNFETIWVLEDDFSVKTDPRELSTLIEKLDALTGKDGWDVLYTDMDSSDPYFEALTTPLFLLENDYESDLKGDLNFFWRPDIELPGRNHFAKRKVLSEDFVEIGSRSRTHSMIIRRSGMKKILDHEKKHHIFLAYDHEIAAVPGIKLFNSRKNLITFSNDPVATSSDTEKKQFDSKSLWETYKKETLDTLSQIPGWTSTSKAETLMNFIHKKKPTTCVDIGAFAGAITYQIARTLHFLKKGTVYAIDTWDNQAAVEGLKGEKIIQWWKNLNMTLIQQQFHSLFSNTPLESYCHPINQKADLAASTFSNESIDFLYIDGNDSEKWNLDNINLYFPKVKEGGYICLDRIITSNNKQTIAFLMKNCNWIREDSFDDYIMFQKKISITSSSYINPEKALYTFDINKYQGDQNEYKKHVADIVSTEVEKIRSILINHQPIEPYFQEILSLFGRLRNEIAKKNHSENAEHFGKKRNIFDSNNAAVPLYGQYKQYGILLFKKFMSLLQQPWKDSNIACELVDSELVEGYQSSLKLEILSCKDMKERAKQEEFLSTLILGGRELAPDIILGSLKITKRNPSSGSIEEEYPLSRYVLAKHTDESYEFRLTKENLNFLTEEDQKFVFHPTVPTCETLLTQKIAPCFAKALSWDGKNINELKTTVSFFRYLFAHTTPYHRGSAAIAEWIEKVIYEYHGYENTYAEGKLVDLDAFVTLQLSEFTKNYLQNTHLTITPKKITSCNNKDFL